MQEEQFMQAYTIKEVSERTGIKAGTIRQWEKDLDGVLHIPRDRKGDRYFTEYEIEMLEKIKLLREKNVGMDAIRNILNESKGYESKVGSGSEKERNNMPQTVPYQNEIEHVSQSEAVQMLKKMHQKMMEMEEGMKALEKRVNSEAILKKTEEIEKKMEERDKKLTQLLIEIRESNKKKGRFSWKFWRKD